MIIKKPHVGQAVEKFTIAATLNKSLQTIAITISYTAQNDTFILFINTKLLV